jgi:hypothetical protein
MVPWLFPVGVVGALAAISLGDVFGYLLAMVWGFVVFPYGAAYIRSHSEPRGGSDYVSDDDTQYWRTRDWYVSSH